MHLTLQTPKRKGQLFSGLLHLLQINSDNTNILNYIYLYRLFQSSCLTCNGERTNIIEQIEKHIIVEFSVFEIHLTTKGHVFGGLVSDLLGMNRICSSMQRLKVLL